MKSRAAAARSTGTPTDRIGGGPRIGGPPTLADAVASLDRQAGDGWAMLARECRWTFFVRLTWARDVGEERAGRRLARWAARLQKVGCVLLVGQHQGPGRRHAHGLLFVPQRWAEPASPPGVRVVAQAWEPWLAWSEGACWLAPYRPWRVGGDPARRGAVRYLSREPGTVELFGSPVPYRPHRRR